VAIIAALILGQFLAQRALKPMLKITGQVQQMAGQDLFRRLDTQTLNQDEIGILAETFNGLLQRIESVFIAKQHFMTDASHEFRTPLSTVLSSTYLIEKYISGDDQPKREKHTQRIISSVNHLTDILNDFLSVGKIEEGKIQVRHAHFNISLLISEIADEMKNNLRNGQEILYEHSGQEDVFTDPSMLKHIVMNLISNASKFSPENSVIGVKSNHGNEHIVISVKDEGMGISPEDQMHLMERFFRGANAVNIQGTGLGLHIVARYAELMNGQVACYSELDKGTEFVVTFNANTF